MKRYFSLLLLFLATSCQVLETIDIHADGSGTIEISKLRDEQSYMQLAGENYSKEKEFVDTTYVFNGFIERYKETFLKLTPAEKAVFQKYNAVKVHIEKNAYEKVYRTTLSQKFTTLTEVPDLYKTEEYTDDLQHNYALSAEEHYYVIQYAFDGNQFQRTVTITNETELKKQQSEVENYKNRFSKINLRQSYILNYHFPKAIQSVSNPKAVISTDKKTVVLECLLSDFLQHPEITNLNVILQQE